MLTIAEKFAQIVEQYGNRIALAFLSDKKYQSISYQELDQQRLNIAKVWQQAGWQSGEKIAIMLPNSAEWIIADLASATLGIVVVPVHTTFNQEYLKRVIVHSGSKYLLIHSDYYRQYQAMIDSLSLAAIIIVGEKIDSDSQRLLFWPELKAKDQELNKPSVDPTGTHTIIYTSGTTGDPKGVMLSHRNLIADIESAKRSLEIKAEDKFFSFLPLSHAFERIGGYYGAIFSGSSVYFAQSMKTIVDDIKLAQPTILTCVPRIFERIYDKIFDKIRVAKPAKKKLFYLTINLAKLKKQKKLNLGQKILYAILNKIVLDKIRQSLGGHLRMAISGGASLNPTIAKFFENLNIKVIEGYGLTETSPIITLNRLENYKYGTVGQPIDCNQIKIADNKEILVKGDNVMLGYFHNEAATQEIIDQDGWLHTGDLGFIDAEGFLTIIGRAKDMIVLSTGKNIFPEPIENILNESQYISQSMVYGDRDKMLRALLVPDFAELKKWCAVKNIDYILPAVLSKPEVLILYRNNLDKVLENLSEVEKIKEFKLVAEEFSQENALLTPSLKLRRGKILSKYVQ